MLAKAGTLAGSGVEVATAGAGAVAANVSDAVLHTKRSESAIVCVKILKENIFP
jgi:predicted secreted protein